MSAHPSYKATASVQASAQNIPLYAAGGDSIVTEPYQIAAGQVLERGAVLKVNPATQELEALSAAADEAFAIMVHHCDTSNGPDTMSVALFGEFNRDALILPTGVTPEDIRISARRNGIFIRRVGYSG